MRPPIEITNARIIIRAYRDTVRAKRTAQAENAARNLLAAGFTPGEDTLEKLQAQLAQQRSDLADKKIEVRAIQTEIRATRNLIRVAK